ncbi:DsbA family protein [Microbacterium caowuchunii]|uniref:Thioredoxin domain-containing protein n=1 Tax=Microbacterium caowuchunii TaxID=2614638 RepID=A0A5N0TFR9_9MICO|nr:thioredoxin domain-containing protein [Microbacterium caowuchunii]KAA9133880.1 thioredoxin domain-containing protein [Microbacterium caowuchunii]
MARAGKKTNWFAVWVSIAAVVAVVVVGALVVWANNASSGPGTAPQSAVIDDETGAIAVGEGEGTIDTYVDFMCPVCASFEATYGSAIESMVEDGTITLNIHPISILDRASAGSEFSTRAANAMYAVAANHPDLALPYLQALFANQPAEGTTGLSNEELIAIAEQVGATDAAEDINAGTYAQFVEYMTKQTPVQPGQSGISTPTIAIDGEVISNSQLTGDPQADLVAKFTR